MASVTLQDVSKVFPGNVRAVEQLELAVADGQLVVIIGPSGCGKTTTLRLIAGLERPSGGTIRIGDRIVNHLAPKDRDLAMVFQNAALYSHLTVFGNLAFGLRMRHESGMRKRRRRKDHRIRSTAQLLGIDHLLGRMPCQLSGGEQQRVALGRAIVRRPAAFLLDEPLSGLDAQLRAEMRRLVKRIHQRLAATIVYVTHDQLEAMTLGDRIVVMERGEIQQTGTPEEVYTEPRNLFVARFFGDPPMNCIRGRWEVREDLLRFVSGGLVVPVHPSRLRWGRPSADQPMVMGIRPENMALVQRGEPADGHGQVADCQLLGDGAILHIVVRPLPGECGGRDSEISIRVPIGRQVPPGTVVPIRLDGRRVHWFDVQTGVNLNWINRTDTALPGDKPVGCKLQDGSQMRHESQ